MYFKQANVLTSNCKSKYMIFINIKLLKYVFGIVVFNLILNCKLNVKLITLHLI